MSVRLFHWFFRQTLLFARIVAGATVLGLALVIALVALPGAIDWADLKPKLGAALTDATGRTVTLAGPLSVEFLPWPAFTIDDVELANAPGAATRSMLAVRRLGMRLSLKALFEGRVEIERLVLDEPRLAIEPGADGSPNWWLPVLQSGGDEASTRFPVSLDRVEVRRGRLLHAIGLVDQPLEAHDLDFVVMLPRGRDHASLVGTGIVNGLAVRTSIEIRTATSSRPPLWVQTDLPGGRVTFEGSTGQRSTADPLRGRVAMATAQPAAFAASLAQMMGRPPLRLDDALLRRIEASGEVSLDDRTLSIRGLALSVDGVQVDGDLGVSAGDVTLVTGRLSVPTIDADRWLGHLRTHPLLAGPRTAAQDSPATSTPLPRFDLVIEVGEARYRRDIIRGLVVAFRFDDAGFHVREAIAVLPGDCHLYYRIDPGGQVLPNRPDRVEIDAHRLRDTLKWLGIDTTSIPADRLHRLRLEGRTKVVESAVLVTDATFALDDQSGTGTARATLALPITISARIDLPRFDLDSYRLTEQAMHGMMPAPAAERPGGATDAMPPPAIDIGLKIAEVIYRRQPVHDVDAQLTIQGNRLTLRHVGVGNLLGSRLEISGSVDDFATRPRLDLSWRGELADIDRVLDYAGLPRFARGRIGAGRTTGRAVGTLDGVSLPELSVDMLDARIAAAGELSFGDELRFDFPRWSLATPDVGAIIAAASGRAQRPIAGFRATGSFRGDGGRATFEGDIVIDGMSLSGRLASTLDHHPTLSIALQAHQDLRLDRWLPAPPVAGAAQALHGWAGSPAAGEPAWPSILKALDGTLSFTAPTVAWGPYEVTGLALTAQLHGGLLEVERFAASLGGATARLSGTVDARQVPVALSVEGEVRDVDISRTIAVAHTANDFGTDDLAVALHGKISFEDVALHARGASLAAALPSLSGKGRASGTIRPVVTRGSLSLASLATGIGSFFSSEMGFASAIIENFVGRWINSRGALEIGEGIVHLREYRLQGERVTALVRGEVDALREALDTRIELNSKDGAIDYAMSLRGPLQAPTLEKDTSTRH